MTSASKLEQNLECLLYLPIELQKTLKLMRDLDDRAQGITMIIDLMANELLPNISKMDEETKNQKISTIKGLFNKAKEYKDDKVQLVKLTYEIVKMQIRSFNPDLARILFEIQKIVMDSCAAEQPTAEQEFNCAAVEKERKNHKGSEKTVKATGKKKITSASNEDDDASGCSAAKKKAQREDATTTATVVKEQEENAHLDSDASDVLDMPVDPNEPTYCICQQVFYGKMIGCDNPDCPIEWFHFPCVGLEITPKGNWYCHKCIQDGKMK